MNIEALFFGSCDKEYKENSIEENINLFNQVQNGNRFLESVSGLEEVLDFNSLPIFSSVAETAEILFSQNGRLFFYLKNTDNSALIVEVLKGVDEVVSALKITDLSVINNPPTFIDIDNRILIFADIEVITIDLLKNNAIAKIPYSKTFLENEIIEKVIFFNSRLFFILKNNQNIYFSSENITSENSIKPFDTLNFFQAELSSDYPISIVASQGLLYVFGLETIQVFTSNEDIALPVIPLLDSLINLGIEKKEYLSIIQETIFFIGSNSNSSKSLYILEGKTPKRISSNYIDSLIRKHEVLLIFGNVEENKTFLYIYFKNEGCYVYDLETETFHRRFFETKRAIANTSETWLYKNLFYFKGDKFILPSFKNSKLYKISDTSDVLGIPLHKERTTKYFYNGNNNIFFKNFSLNTQKGLASSEGLTDIEDAEITNTNNQIFLMQYSDNEGRTWNNSNLKFWKQGEYKKPFKFGLLGSSYKRVFRIMFDTKEKVTLSLPYMEVTSKG